LTTREFKARLQRRARRAGLGSLSSEVADALEAYYRLLQLWNHKINLTALPLAEAPDRTLDRLFIEPLLAARHLSVEVSKAIDLGSGGGSPAIPLAVAAHRITFRLVEVKTRKSAFLREVARRLELDRVSVETSRFEELLSRPDLHEAMDLATVRAVRMETRVLRTVQAFLKPGGDLFMFRGPAGPGEPLVAPPLELRATHSLVESLGSRLVILRKSALPAQQMFHVEQR
jgi:16S rRNA (guanine527-N7)-methyltransferase